jgi:hypothetical protein
MTEARAARVEWICLGAVRAVVSHKYYPSIALQKASNALSVFYDR